jgi:SAM-dependent methyltransferase
MNAFPNVDWLASLPSSDYERQFVRAEYAPGLPYYLARLDRLAFTGTTVLDAGCGVGQWSLALAERFARVVGVDLHRRRLALARASAAAVGADNVAFSIGSVEWLPFAAGCFDAVFCYGVVMFTDVRLSLSQISRVLKPGGRAYFCLNGDGWNHHLIRERGLRDEAVARMGRDVMYTTYWQRALARGLRACLAAEQGGPDPLGRLTSSREGRDLLDSVRGLGPGVEARLLDDVAAVMTGRVRAPRLSVTRAFLPEEFAAVARAAGLERFQWAHENGLSLVSEPGPVPNRYFGEFEGQLAVWECLLVKAGAES